MLETLTVTHLTGKLRTCLEMTPSRSPTASLSSSFLEATWIPSFWSPDVLSPFFESRGRAAGQLFRETEASTVRWILPSPTSEQLCPASLLREREPAAAVTNTVRASDREAVLHSGHSFHCSTHMCVRGVGEDCRVNMAVMFMPTQSLVLSF